METETSKMSDVKYVYEKIKKDMRIKLVNSYDLGWSETDNIKVLFGKSNGIKLYLSQDSMNDFTLVVMHEDYEVMHWHPDSPDDCINDILSLLSDMIIAVYITQYGKSCSLLQPTINLTDKEAVNRCIAHEQCELVKF